MIHQQDIHLQTAGHRDMHDITRQVAGVVEKSKVRAGLATVFLVGSTGALGTIEFEPGLERDLPELLDTASLSWAPGNRSSSSNVMSNRGSARSSSPSWVNKVVRTARPYRARDLCFQALFCCLKMLMLCA